MRVFRTSFTWGCLVAFVCLLAHLARAADVPAAGAVTGAVTEVVTNAAAADVPADVVGRGLSRVGLLRHEFLGEPLWKYGASLIYVLLALYSARFINWLVRVRLKRWAAKTATEYDDLLLEVIHGPVKVVVFVILLHVGLRAFAWPVLVQDYLSIGLRVIVAWSITYMLVKAVDAVLLLWRRRAAAEADKLFDGHLFPVIRRGITFFVIVIAVLVTAQNLGLNITSLLAGLSIGGLALGLAAQDTVANLFGAVAVFLDKPFRVGDRIQVENFDGVVEAIGIRSTRLRNLDGHLVTIPNKTMGNASITNVSRRPTIKTVMNIGITYDTPAERVKLAGTILGEVYRAHPMTADVWVSFNQFGDSALNFLIIHWWNSTDYRAYLEGMQAMNLQLKARFDDAGLSFAFPTRTLYVKQDSDWRITGEGKSAPPPGEPAATT